MAVKTALVIGGVYCICAAAFDWEFFFSNYRARFFVKLFGRNGARTFYAVLGVFFLLFGIFCT